MQHLYHGNFMAVFPSQIPNSKCRLWITDFLMFLECIASIFRLSSLLVCM